MVLRGLKRCAGGAGVMRIVTARSSGTRRSCGDWLVLEVAETVIRQVAGYEVFDPYE